MPTLWSEIGMLAADVTLRSVDHLREGDNEPEEQRAFLRRCHTVAFRNSPHVASPFSPLVFPRAAQRVRTQQHRAEVQMMFSAAPPQAGADVTEGFPEAPRSESLSSSSDAMAGSDEGDVNAGDSDVTDSPWLRDESQLSPSGSVIIHHHPDSDHAALSEVAFNLPSPVPVACSDAGDDDEDDFFSVHDEDPGNTGQWRVYTTPARPDTTAVRKQAGYVPGSAHSKTGTLEAMPMSGTIVQLLKHEAQKASSAALPPPPKPVEVHAVHPKPNEAHPRSPAETKPAPEPAPAIPSQRLNVGFVPTPWADQIQTHLPCLLLRVPAGAARAAARRQADDWSRFGEPTALNRGFGLAHSGIFFFFFICDVFAVPPLF